MRDRLTLEIEKGVDDKHSKVGISVPIEIADGGGSDISESVVLIPKCTSYKSLEKEVAQIKEELDALREQSRKMFGTEGGEEETMDLNEDMSAQEIWDILSTIQDQEILLKEFNSLSQQKRFEVADYVLTHCNVFSGAGSVFSMRYDSEEGILE